MVSTLRDSPSFSEYFSANSQSVQERQWHSKFEQKQLVNSGYSDFVLLKGFRRCDTYLPMYGGARFLSILSLLVALGGVVDVRISRLLNSAGMQHMYIFISLVTSFGILEGTGNRLRSDHECL